ncbi:hypothetical protein OCU04_011188 [Sclerotinia nivalis]|uniref:Ketoreductase domain-containing protein n=1 Tax=Sclerotinia nivalis TaxID=352851 RepID=A0A9X0ABA5_9HELO|nr:hypothetical protein OCU04_011188 [Sclerotinia nivalis]
MTTSPPINTVLIVGGSGALGHRLVTELLSLQTPPQNIYVFDLRTQQNRISTVHYHDVDISDKEQVYAALEALNPVPEVVFHTASPPFGLLDLDLYLRVNVEGTRNLLEAAKKFGIKAFVYTSSASVIHDAVTLADELVLKHNDPTHSFLTTCIRPSGIFGENDPGSVKSFAERAAAGKLKIQIGDGKNLFDFTYVGNVIDAHILAAQKLLLHLETPVKDESMRVDGQGFLITNDEHIPFWEFARAIGDAAGHPTREEDVKSIPKIVGLFMAIVAEWMVWILSFGRKKSRVNRVGTA